MTIKHSVSKGRKMKKTFSAILALSALLLASCGKPAASAVPQTQQPESVVAVSKSIGELWLLSGGRLSGITGDGMTLSGIGKDTVSIGTVSNPSLEAILSLKPDMVMLSEDIPSQNEMVSSLEDSGITVYPVDINSFADYQSMMKELIGMTGRKDLYQTNVSDVADRIEKIRKKADTLPQASCLALRISAAKSKALKEDSFITEILSDLHMKNLASDASALNELNTEAIAAMNPDYLFIVYGGEEEEAKSIFETRFASDPLWQNLTAVKENHVCHLPKDLFQYKPNARWDEAYEYIYEIRKK